MLIFGFSSNVKRFSILALIEITIIQNCINN